MSLHTKEIFVKYLTPFKYLSLENVRGSGSIMMLGIFGQIFFTAFFNL